MIKFIHRTTLQTKEAGSQANHSLEDWIHFPDTSTVDGIDKKYWKISGDSVLEMTAEEKTTKDTELEEDKWVTKRSERNSKLTACDWTQLSDAPLTAEKVTEWATYRQSLRDIPATYANADDVVWPIEPA